MSAKRQATTELNYDNWDEEDEPEEAGVFRVAPEEELKKRVIKKARRTIREPEKGAGNEAPKSVFSSFSGFGTLSSSDNNPKTPFSFLSKMTEKSSASEDAKKPNFVFNTVDNKKSLDTKVENAAEGKINKDTKSAEFCRQLVSLNQAFSDWIKTCVDKDPVCFLSPVLKNYETYLKKLESEEEERSKNKSADVKDSAATSTATTTTTAATTATAIAPTFSFGSSTSTSLFGKETAKSSNGFSFGAKSSNNEEKSAVSASSSSGFSFSAGSSSFSFGNIKYPTATTTATQSENKEAEEDVEDVPPKVEFTQVVEEGSSYTKKCKVFVKKNDEFVDRGVGTLYLKPVQDGEKTQLLVRADTNLGNILVNLILSAGIPVQRTGKNNVMLVCIPTPEEKKAVPLLIRVKTAEEADELLKEIKSLQK